MSTTMFWNIKLVVFTLLFGLAVKQSFNAKAESIEKEPTKIGDEKSPVEKGKSLNIRKIVLQSPNITDWGVWGEWDTCLPGMFVHQMRLKTERYQGAFLDDTALNGIRLFCSPPGREQEYSYKIESDVGDRGEWGNLTSCPRVPSVGFQLRSEADQGSAGDDAAATNFRLLCASRTVNYVTYVEGDGVEWGDWTMEQRCPLHHAICGIQTQVETSKGTGDATGLNNVRVECCPLHQHQRRP